MAVAAFRLSVSRSDFRSDIFSIELGPCWSHMDSHITPRQSLPNLFTSQEEDNWKEEKWRINAIQCIASLVLQSPITHTSTTSAQYEIPSVLLVLFPVFQFRVLVHFPVGTLSCFLTQTVGTLSVGILSYWSSFLLSNSDCSYSLCTVGTLSCFPTRTVGTLSVSVRTLSCFWSHRFLLVLFPFRLFPLPPTRTLTPRFD